MILKLILKSWNSSCPGMRKKRLDRFVNQESKQNFILCRGILHLLLSKAENIPPESFNIQNGAEGKPQMSIGLYIQPVHFNISHTQDLCLIALCRSFEVGVDVECIHLIRELPSLARTYLSVEEFKKWLKRASRERNSLFYKYWCAKEALLKAAGCGLSIHPAQVNTLEAIAGQPVRGVREDGSFFEFRGCFLKDLALGRDYHGWLAVLGEPKKILCFDLSPQLLAVSFFADGRNVE